MSVSISSAILGKFQGLALVSAADVSECRRTFSLELDEVAQSKSHGLGVHRVEDLGCRGARQRDAIQQSIVGQFSRVLRTRHSSNADHLNQHNANILAQLA